jgi:hypothetical protein
MAFATENGLLVHEGEAAGDLVQAVELARAPDLAARIVAP